MINFLIVGCGGFIGSGLRYLLSQIPIKVNIEIPILTLLINFIGSLLIGIISSTLTELNLNLLFKTGLCGGFTTFSTFSLETFNMIESKQIHLAILYSFTSVLLCLIGVLIGKTIGKVLLSR